MFQIQHLNAGAPGRERLVIDEVDILRLIDLLHERFGEALLAYCIMHTHLHVIVEGDLEKTRAILSALLRAYGHAFLGRHGLPGPLLRGPVHGTSVPGPFELARGIKYVHNNPVPNLSSKAIVYEWSSARAFVGLARVPYPNVARARLLMGRHVTVAIPGEPVLANLEPRTNDKGHEVGLIIAASARVHGITSGDVLGRTRAPRVLAAKAAVVALAKLEGQPDERIAAALGLDRTRIVQIRAEGADLEAVRAVRSVLRLPSLRERLEAAAMSEAKD